MEEGISGGDTDPVRDQPLKPGTIMEHHSIIGGIRVEELAPVEVIAERLSAYTITVDEASRRIAEAARLFFGDQGANS